MVQRYAAAVSRAAPGGDARRLALAALGGQIGAVPPDPLPGAPAPEALPAAAVLGVLQYDAESLAILARFPPAAHEQILSIALRVVPRVPPPLALAQRDWILAMVEAMRGFGLNDRFGPFVRSLQQNGHFELAAAIRAADGGARLGATDGWLLDARAACWAGEYQALREQLAAAPDDPSIAGEVALLGAVVRGAAGELEVAIAELDAIRAQGVPALRDLAGRWKAELVLRRAAGAAATPPSWWRSLLGRSAPAGAAARDQADAARAAIREASDHVVLRLLTWIGMLREPDDGRREVVRDFHEWVIAGLERERVAGIEPLVTEWRRSGDEATLWKMVALFGGNRGEPCTVVEDGRLRALALRTARQEAVEIQRRLRQVGLDATLRTFAALAAEWPRLVVFRTYSAELLLWAGRYQESADQFEAVCRTTVNRWGQIGHGAALAGLGRTAEAERVWEEGLRVHRGALDGEASRVYRAEAAMAGGHLDEADALLRHVMNAKPTRLRGWLLAAELGWLRGDAAAGRAALLQAAITCPALADADGPVALAAPLHDPAAAERRDDAIARCRALRAALRGNSSSWLFTWFDAQGTMHAVTHTRPSDLEMALDRLERLP